MSLAGIGVMSGAFDAGSTPQGIATVPEIIWEAFLGLYLTFFKGFNPSAPLLVGPADRGGGPATALAAS